MYVCMYVRMNVLYYMCVCMYIMFLRPNECMYMCMYICIYVCVWVCMYSIITYVYTHFTLNRASKKLKQ